MSAPFLLDLSHTSHTSARTGIQRVARSLWRELGDSARPITYDPHQRTWRALDAWDDFEGKPLHGTCFIAADGRMRWQHVGYEPFMLPDFLLEETRRLLEIPENPECLLRR